MKLFWILSLVVFAFCGSVNTLFAFSSDTINVFLQEFIDGKPVDEFIHFEFFIYSMSEKEGDKWLLSEEDFLPDEVQKDMMVNLTQTRTDDDCTTPYIKNVRWVLGRKMECTYEPCNGGMSVELKAVKGNGNKYDWNVYCVGSYKLTGNDSTHKWEFKSVKEETLKFNKLRFQNKYYWKDK